MRHKPLVLLIFTLISIRSIDAAVRPWTEVRSPHFTVFTNGTAGDGRRVAREFEQMRAVFANGFPDMRLETGAPLIIFAARDEESMKALNPSQWRGKHVPRIAGYFSHHWEKTFAIIRLDQDVPGAYQVVYHEYVHSLMHANFRWLPHWLDEGLADYYGGSVFQDKKTYVGAPSLRMGRIRNRLLIPLEKLIVQNPYVAYRGDEERIDTFYGESEALIHYLLFGESMENGKKFTEFFGKVERGQDQVKAFKESFGELATVQKQFELYLRAFAFATFVVGDPPQIDQKDFGVRTISLAETEAALAVFRIWARDFSEAKEMVDSSLRDDPALADAHTAKAFLLFASAKDSEAAAEFAKAFALNDKDYIALYYKTMLSPEARSDNEQDQVALRTDLGRVLTLNRQFAPAYVELCKLFLKWGELDHAAAVARSAEMFEPTRAGYHLLLARILQRKGKTADAAKLATYVAERWSGPDHDEAQELLNSLPAADRAANLSSVQESPTDPQKALQHAEGKIHAVTCNEQDGQRVLSLDHDSGTTDFLMAGGFPIGYSDTLWFGADHFDICHHLDGLRALVLFNPPGEKNPVARIAKLEIRDDLPSGPAPKISASPALPKQNP